MLNKQCLPLEYHFIPVFPNQYMETDNGQVQPCRAKTDPDNPETNITLTLFLVNKLLARYNYNTV